MDSMFSAEDFEVTGLSEEGRKYYFAHLAVRCTSFGVIEVRSQRSDDYYRVVHDYVEPVECPCRAGTFGKCKAHFQRVKLVLLRRTQRLEREQKETAQERRREAMPLNGNRAFSLL